jgi:hypothetical protein
MIRGLLVLDENLASSIALRYAGQLSAYMPIQFKAAHVEDPSNSKRTVGTGWVQRTWEKGIEDAGIQTVQRLIKTEKVGCQFLGAPQVFIGNRDDELLEALSQGNYDLFVEGNLNTSNVNDFYNLINAKLYSKSKRLMLIVKNLVNPGKIVLICGDGVDPDILVPQFVKFIKETSFISIDLLFYKFQESDSPVLLAKTEGGSAFSKIEEMLQENDIKIHDNKVVCGTPEQTANLFRGYGLAFTTFPTRKSVRLELLANIPTPIILCR